jgi:hypothetical protein
MMRREWIDASMLNEPRNRNAKTAISQIAAAKLGDGAIRLCPAEAGNQSLRMTCHPERSEGSIYVSQGGPNPDGHFAVHSMAVFSDVVSSS